MSRPELSPRHAEHEVGLRWRAWHLYQPDSLTEAFVLRQDDQSTNPRRRILQLDGLRAIAFIAVFLHHSLGLPLLWAGVDLFFVLSGFLITGILLRQKGSADYYKTFYYRRFLRILPPYYLVLLVAFTLRYPDRVDRVGWYASFLSNFQDAFVGGGPPALAPMWSLAVEEQFYIVWPFVVASLTRAGLLRLCIGLLAAAPIARVCIGILTADFRPVYALLPCRFDLLAAGALLAMLPTASPHSCSRRKRWTLIAGLVASLLFLTLAVRVDSFRTSANSILFNSVGYSLILVVVVSVVLLALDEASKFCHRILCLRPLRYLGQISYTLYLVHELVIDFVTHFLSAPRHAQAATSLFLSIGVAAASWHWLESPLLRLKDRRFGYGQPD